MTVEILNQPQSPLKERTNSLIKNAEKKVFKEINDKNLHAYIFQHDKKKKAKAAICFFCGGKWDKQVITQFAPHCMHFSSIGMLALVAEYRTSLDNVSPLEAIKDARTLVRWLRFNQKKINIDPDKIILAGASSGAHIALSTTLNLKEDINEDDEDQSISCKPNCLILFEPITDTSKKGIGEELFIDKIQARKASPINNILRKQMPPSLIFHGTANRLIPFVQSVRFTRLMKRKKNICELIKFDGRDSGFFNFNVDINLYEITLNQSTNFLIEHGFLPPD